MELRVTNKIMDTNPIKRRLTQGEAMVDRPRIILHQNYEGLDLGPLNYEIRAVSDKETMVRRPLEKVVEGGRVILTWTVTKEFTAVSGDIALTVIGIDSTGTEIIKITSDKITIRPDPEGDWVAPPPSVVEDAINQMAVIQAATIAAKNETERLRDEAVQNMEAAAADIVAETEAIRDAAAESARQAAASAEGAAGSASTAGDIRDETETIKFETEKILENTINIEHAIKMLAEKAQQFAGLAQQYADMASQIAYGQKGYYRTPEALQAAYPEGQDGWWAVVGTTDTIWVWDSDSGAWVDSRQGTDMTNYPQWAQLANKLMVPCTCAYNAETHIFSLTRKDISQMLQDGAELTFIPPAGYTQGDTIEFEGAEISLEYAGSPVDVQPGAWLAGHPAKLIWYADNEQGGSQNEPLPSRRRALA